MKKIKQSETDCTASVVFVRRGCAYLDFLWTIENYMRLHEVTFIPYQKRERETIH